METKITNSLSMMMKNSQQQQINLTQRLMMSTQMQQALKLLQLPLQELEIYIEEQVVLNPILDICEGEAPEEGENDTEESASNEEEVSEAELQIDDNNLQILSQLDEDLRDHFSQTEYEPKQFNEENKLKSYVEQSITNEQSLYEKLIEESLLSFEQESERLVAEILIGYIDENGFFDSSLDEVCQLHQIDRSIAEKILKVIQTFEPHGVGASSIQETLLIQLERAKKEDTLAYRIVRDCYDQLIHNQIPLIQKKLQCSLENIQQALDQEIAKLDLHPGRNFSKTPVYGIIPDVTIRMEDDVLIVDIERDCFPLLKINRSYLKLLEDPETPVETKHFIKQHLLSARWLMRNIQQRFSTLERIAQALTVKQREFFINPRGQLAPLTMKSIAEELKLNESTIVRTVSNKYLFSPRGIHPFRAFFTGKYISNEGEDLSSTTVKEAILAHIEKEDKMHPLSDEKISGLLKEQGIPCARRTVAKYRSLFNIGNTQQRRKFRQ